MIVKFVCPPKPPLNHFHLPTPLQGRIGMIITRERGGGEGGEGRGGEGVKYTRKMLEH